MSKPVRCFLRCVAETHAPISLPHLEDVILGRCPETQITDKRCSKKQLAFRADVSKLSVMVRHLGTNFSAVNGRPLGRNGETVAQHGDTVNFLLGQFEYVVEFDPCKRKLDCDESEDEPNTSKKAREDPGTSSQFEQDTWQSIENGKLLTFLSKGCHCSDKIAAYDMDGTIITTKSGKVFPENPNDWKILWPEIPSKLQKLHRDGFKIVIFTNQAGISRGKTTVSEIQQKIGKVISALGVPVQAFVATGDTIFRKPAPGMWDILTKERNGELSINMDESFYCGDAAGRPENWVPKRKKDFSCSDRLFARNLGLRFYTPEEHFLGQRAAPFKLPDFDPALMPEADAALIHPPSAKLISSSQEILLMVGFPGSGKSFFCKEYLIPAGYKHVNRDTLGSWQKCVAAAESALKGGHSVVVDNTNPDAESRARYIELASKYKIPCRCAMIGESITRARHNNKFRELIGEPHQPISEMIMNSHKSKFKEPEETEGFQEVIKISFKPKFTNKKHERLYKMYLLDKY
ncbi:uncharacterized protein F21D5.5 [Thrips palmi]|uniref:Uncharacterized protein F21D5.5 n=1 Tax=Thrips palmi TaxID=161013 RepID=A0A6P8YU58_THRPL|nr:uncharacterized protein F21D5.5 [Thrips palmi]